MKKVLSIIFTMGILLSAISCQESEFSDFGKGFKIKATIEPMDTRVDFAVNNADKTITPTWSVGDKIIGCDDQGQKFTFSVKSVNGKYAQLDANGYVPGEAKRVFAIYYPGKTVDDLQVAKTDTSFNASLEIDLTTQDGTLGASSPAIMCASADIKDFSGLTLDFKHQTAIVAINAIKVNPGENIKNIAVTGSRTMTTLQVTSATGSLERSSSSFRKPVNVATDLTADSEGVINTPIYVTVVPSDMVNLSVVATNDKGEKSSNINSAIKSDLLAGKYYYTSRILGNVATIVETGKQYGSIEEAFWDAEAATSAVTIKLLADCTIIEDMPQLTNSYGITIDLNGKTLTATASVLNSDETKMYKRIWIETANVTIKDSVGGGKLNHAAGNTYNVVMHGFGTLTVESGSIESLYPKEDDGSVAILLNDGELFLNGGTIRGNSSSYGTVSLRGTENTVPAVTVPENSTVVVTGISEYAVHLEMADGHFHGGEFTTGNSYALNATDNSFVDIDGGKFTAFDPNDGTDAIALRFYNGPNVTISGGEFFGTTRAFSCNASESYSGDQGVVSIIGGKFESKNGYSVYGGRKADILLEGGSFYSEKNSNFFQGYTSGSLTVADCYAYTGAADVDSLCIRGNYAKAYGGFYNTPILEKNITNAKVCKTLDTPVEYEGHQYGYTLGENESYVAEVDGNKYKDMVQASNAAIAYDGPNDPVVIKLIDDCKIDFTVDYSNALYKEIVLDLNGHTLTTNAKDSCITTNEVLTITDNSEGAKGKILAEKRKPIFLFTRGTINIKKVTIECTATGAYTDAQRCIISIKGKSGEQDGTVNISDGAKIIADNWFKCIYVSYGKLVTENCEITSGYAHDKAYFGIYGYTGADITCNDGTNIKCNGLIDSCGVAFNVASGNTSKGSIFKINGGYYYGGAQSGASIKSGSENGVKYASKTLQVNGGYFRHDIDTIGGHYGEGKALVKEENKHSFMGEELIYNYVVR